MNFNVYVIGNGIGESILIHIPGFYCILVDCYETKNNRSVTNLLRKLKINKIDILCWTHPHYDHYLGMSNIFNEFDVRSFWRFEGNSLQSILAKQMLHPEEIERNKAKELEELFRCIKKFIENNSTGFHRVQNGYQYNFRINEKSSIKINVFAPFSSIIDDIEDQLLNKLKNIINDPDEDYSDVLINRLSVVLSISINKTNIILLSDIDNKVLDLLNGFVDFEDYKIIKVPHHYSKSCNVVISKIDKSKIAISTPFTRYRLPNIEVYNEYAARRKAYISNPISLDSQISFSSNQIIDQKERIAIKFGFNDNGICESYEYVKLD
jgi:beta-lactamase superfamily II metal-dependent hydrolase